MKSLRIHPVKIAVALVTVLSASSGCGEDKTATSGNPAGASGSGGSAGSAGSAGSGTLGGSAGVAGNGGSGGSAVVPDELKDCGVAADPSVPPIQLTEFASGLTRPVYLTQARGDDTRFFVVEKVGRVSIVQDGVVSETPFLDLTDRVSEGGSPQGEMGLLGLAFHPDYADNGRFYVFYSVENGGRIERISEFTADSADSADPESERILIEITDPESNHNGGNLAFGPDGFLYIGSGDGGGANDRHGATGNGQNVGVMLGKILRIDVDGTGAGANSTYAIPPGNMAGAGVLPEIWSYGLRNPWRYSFDACTGDMYIGDVGQDELEEVDFEPANTAGRNYGWRLMEADACFNPNSGCNAATQNLILPVAQYDHDTGQSITGGYVYRGSAIPNLRGTYLYADYVSATFFALRMQGGAVAQAQLDISDNINPGGDVVDISSFAQDNVGELYVLSLDGTVYRIDAE